MNSKLLVLAVKLSIVIITFNEASNIRRCLNSVMEIADEIVVLDSFSTDETESICREFPIVNFYQHPFEGYVEQKRLALSYASCDHFLNIDADEELSENLRKEIENIKISWDKDGYYLNRLSNFAGKWIRHSGWHPDWVLRLGKKNSGIFDGVDPHESFQLVAGGTTGRCKGFLYHYTYPTVKDQVNRLNHFSEMKADTLFKKRKKAVWWRFTLYPFVVFCKHFFMQRGFLDGYFGFAISVGAAYYTFLTYFKLWLKQRAG